MADGEGLDAAGAGHLPAETVAAILASSAYATLRRRRDRLAAVLTALILLAFLGFTAAVAFDKALLAAPIGQGVTSWGIPSGFALILLSIALTGLYVRRANRHFDALVQRIRADVGA